MCQGVQHFTDIIFLGSGITFGKALGNAVVAGIKHHLGAGLSIKNLYITADNSARRSISMVIPNLGNAFGIGNMDRIVIIYLDNAGRCLILTANKAAQMRNAIVNLIVRPTVARKISSIKTILARSIFINPLCAVLQPQVYLTCFFSTGIVNNTLPEGILCSQAKIDASVPINKSFFSLF